MRFQNEDEYKKFIASRAANDPGPVPKPEPDTKRRAAATAKAEGGKKATDSASYRVVIISRRMRAMDPDNVTVKAEIDEIVNAGFLPDDSSNYVDEVVKRVERVSRAEEEETVIEIWKKC